MSVTKPQPFRLYLLRHAQAAWPNPGERDFDRKLDDKGYDQAELIADRAVDKRYKPDLILSSTATRCRETTDAFRRAFNESVEIAYVDEMYNAQPETYLSLILGQQEISSLMLVGHNPTMEGTIEALIGHEALQTALPDGFPTAGLAVLDVIADSDGKTPQWRLIEFLVP
ncbi:histidine phosphatase family protein [Agrobacterium larrymoorei]|uniref:SixA phosphatase family protein n=1 Tax=Agrobacterium larrymoorei TaxID=160699 RepID=UPI001573B9D7|nr:histidine phosphatase family protein [Agrobacterium larrymoorei]NTJ42252.1 histidine phosphatase family protein [Agrobacterium larrymoorei]